MSGSGDRKPTAFPGPILITGAASGIGRALALLLADSGVQGLVLVDRDPSVHETQEAVRERLGVVHGLVLDVSDQRAVNESLAELADAIPYLGGVVNCAGILGRQAPVERAEADDWLRVLSVNLLGAVYVTAACLPLLRKAPGRKAAVVNVTSVVGLSGAPRHPAYAASKAALWSVTLSLARELAGEGIRVNAVAPGSVMGTRLGESAPGGARVTPEVIASVMANVPLRRLPRPVEIAGAAAFLLSSDTPHITGIELIMDGGERWRLQP